MLTRILDNLLTWALRRTTLRTGALNPAQDLRRHYSAAPGRAGHRLVNRAINLALETGDTQLVLRRFLHLPV